MIRSNFLTLNSQVAEPAVGPNQLSAPQPQGNALSLMGIFVALSTECDQILFRILS